MDTQSQKSLIAKIDELYRKRNSVYNLEENFKDIIISALRLCVVLLNQGGSEETILKVARIFLVSNSGLFLFQILFYNSTQAVAKQEGPLCWQSQDVFKCFLVCSAYLNNSSELLIQMFCTILVDLGESPIISHISWFSRFFLHSSAEAIQHQLVESKVKAEILSVALKRLPQVNSYYTQMKLVHVVSTMLRNIQNKEEILKQHIGVITADEDLAEKLLLMFKSLDLNNFYEVSSELLSYTCYIILYCCRLRDRFCASSTSSSSENVLSSPS